MVGGTPAWEAPGLILSLVIHPILKTLNGINTGLSNISSPGGPVVVGGASDTFLARSTKRRK